MYDMYNVSVHLQLQFLKIQLLFYFYKLLWQAYLQNICVYNNRKFIDFNLLFFAEDFIAVRSQL